MGGVRARVMNSTKLLMLYGLIFGAIGCGNSQLSATTQAAMAGWELSERTLFVDGKPANSHVAALLESLASPAGPGQAITEQEFREMLGQLSADVYAEKIIKYATPQSVAIQNKEHADYSKVFMKPGRIKAGLKFLADNDSTLEKAEKLYSVEKKDIIAILMWESGLGEFVGNHYIFNVFLGQILYLDKARDLAVRDLIAKGEVDSTAMQLGAVEKRRLDRLKRAAVINLVSLIRISKEQNVDATLLKGSWGGAIGYVQFMPSSMQFAKDGDGDGRIDLCTWPDAIFSVANYLHENGYGATAKARRRAIRAYNPIDSYVDGVIRYADAVWKRHQESMKK